MKCNYKRKNEFVYRKNLILTIHKSMSYQEVIYNTVALTSDFIPELPEKTQHLLVRTVIENRIFSFFLDLSPISKSLGHRNELVGIAPITADLLELYGVSPLQFIKDFKDAGAVVTRM